MKKIIIAVWIFFILCFTVFVINYAANEVMIRKYHSGEYESNSFSVLGFTEPYIADYNQGNIYFKSGDYENAIISYKNALDKNPPHDRECKIRINLALSMVTPINPEEITEDNVDEVINTLEEAKDVLIEHGCANRDDHNGHNKDAQTLKDEIDAFEEQLKEQKNEPKDTPDTPDDKKDDDKDDKEKDEREEKRKQLEDLENQGIEEKNRQGNSTESFWNDSIFYDGPTW